MSDAFLGLDRSGNDNNWTVNNMTLAADQVVDSPTNNFATFNAIADDTTGATTEVFSEGNLKVGESGTGWSNIFGTMGMPSGKYYWESYMSGSGSTDCNVGVVKSSWYRGSNGGIDTVDAFSLYAGSDGNGYKYDSGSGTNLGTGYHFTWGNIVQVAYDADSGKMWIGKNNTWLGSGNPATGANPFLTVGSSIRGDMLPAWSQYHAANSWTANFGQDSSFAGAKTAQGNQDGNEIGDFYYTPPTGFLALCTSNLPDVAVTPSEHFNTVLYSGSGSAQSITGVGFAPDFSWFKSRSNSDYHNVYDSVRGGIKYLLTDLTEAEQTAANGFVSLDSDGFSLDNAGSGGEVNGSGKTYVSWNWKANGSGSSNTDGDITSTVSVNTDAGFSIVAYTGNDVNGETIGHGLSKAPELVIIKAREGSYTSVGWGVIGSVLSSTTALKLNDTAATVSAAGVTTNTLPTATVFTVADNYNHSGSGHIAYCFHSVDGYSKCSSFVGNGSADGVFVYTGFAVKWVLIKRTNSAGQGSPIFDSARNEFNVTNKRLNSNDSVAEVTTDGNIDLLSNGFKARNTDGSVNTSGGTYIYLAFAETPFKYSNAR
jgi:hypothetical protein